MAPNFDCISELNTPWRWIGKNEKLGSWLQEARVALIRGEPVSLEGAPVHWVEAPRARLPLVQMQICHKIASGFDGSVVAIHKWPRDCHAVASRLKGRYFVIEAIDCKDLMEGADAIGQNTGPSRAYNLYQFTSKCMTKVGSELRASCQSFLKGQSTASRKLSCARQIEVLNRVAADDSMVAVSEALAVIRKLPGARIYRKELFDEMMRAVEEYKTGDYESLSDAAWAVRNRTRHIGRRLSRGTVGTTLLIKGLEFDHAIVLDADKLDIPNLYVAMTRGSESLTIISKRSLILPQ